MGTDREAMVRFTYPVTTREPAGHQRSRPYVNLRLLRRHYSIAGGSGPLVDTA